VFFAVSFVIALVVGCRSESLNFSAVLTGCCSRFINNVGIIDKDIRM